MDNFFSFLCFYPILSYPTIQAFLKPTNLGLVFPFFVLFSVLLKHVFLGFINFVSLANPRVCTLLASYHFDNTYTFGMLLVYRIFYQLWVQFLRPVEKTGATLV